MLFCTVCSFAGRQVKTYDISFSEEEFTFKVNNEGQLLIESNSSKICFYPEGNEPNLPLFSSDIALSGGYEYVSSSIQVKKRLIKSNVVLSQAIPPVPSSEFKNTSVALKTTYPLQVFPDSVCKYIALSHINGATLFHFLTSPFVYDAPNRDLYFIDRISLEITVEDKPSVQTRKKFGSEDISFIKSMAINGEEFQPMVNNVENALGIDYVIITTEALRSAFEPLLNWKRAKGLRSCIYTVEDINKIYTGNDVQLRIKTCLYDLYSNYGLSYALLGGDNTVVPVRYCYNEVKANSGTYTENIPSDLFYACFDGDFNWNANGNNRFGEIDDNVNFGASISITRLPVRSIAHTQDVVKKIIQYEQNPRINKKTLLAGVQVHYMDSISQLSDATLYGRKMKETYISPHWDGEILQYYDSYTDFEGGEKYTVNTTHTIEQLNRGYAVIEMNTHGSTLTWSMEQGGSFSSTDVSQLKNSWHSVIITDACHTNWFDSAADPCLSEAFLRNYNSGIIAYIGSSRYGWEGISASPTLLYSPLISATLLKNIFTPENSNKNWGKLVKQTKASLISNSSLYGPYRWLLNSLNPMGDPEMEIYIDTPKKFTTASISYESNLGIKTGNSGCTIRVMSKEDNGESFYRVWDNAQNISLASFPMYCNVAIIKNGYIPKTYSFSLLQNEVIPPVKTYVADIIKVGSSVTSAKSSGKVYFRNKDVKLNAPRVVLEKGTVIEKGGSVTIVNENL